MKLRDEIARVVQSGEYSSPEERSEIDAILAVVREHYAPWEKELKEIAARCASTAPSRTLNVSVARRARAALKEVE